MKGTGVRGRGEGIGRAWGGRSTPPYKLVNRHGGAGSARSKWPFGHLSLSLPAPSTPTPLSLHYCNPIVLNKLRRWAVSSPPYDTSSRNHDYFVARLGMVAFKPNGFQSPSRTSTYSCVELTMGSEVPASVNAEKVSLSL